MKDDDDGLYWETKVAAALGVARKVVADLRREKLESGTHYVRKGNAVVLTATGVERITALVNGEDPPDNAAVDALRAGPPKRMQMTVMRVHGNKRLISCQAKGEDLLRLVRVKTNENFMPRMVLEAIEAGAGMWQFTGRLPRRKGRW